MTPKSHAGLYKSIQDLTGLSVCKFVSLSVCKSVKFKFIELTQLKTPNQAFNFSV